MKKHDESTIEIKGRTKIQKFPTCLEIKEIVPFT